MDMKIATIGNEEVDFLSDPMDRFPLLDLAGEDLVLAHGRSQAVVCEPAESNIGEAGDAVLAVENDLNSTCQGIALSAPASEQSTGKDDPQAPAWARRIRVERSALELTIRSYAEKKTETVIVPAMGGSFDTLGEAYDYYNLYSWEVGLGIRYGKKPLNVERTKCMQEIVCGCSESTRFIFTCTYLCLGGNA
ncbi:uncharacterized protein [Aegilops tauschii subsp. strangulata]|uniref:uncharacterized protein isoform X1 n=1 Tax=Aegilops tauschii subsp. strangulata TaxID=200361 RepID=UPI001E1CAA88|nr:uncharacterized protein LOC109749873 [Aegilops tauschii subsp. strangulata]